MEAWVHREVSEQYKRFCTLSRPRKLILLLSPPFLVTASFLLSRLIDSRPWIGYGAGAIVFINWLWHWWYPTLKRRITEEYEEYREIATGGLRRVPILCKHLYRGKGPLASWLKVVLLIALLYPFPFGSVLQIVLQFIVLHPLIPWVAMCGCALAFIRWVWSRGYPALKQKLGPTGIDYVRRPFLWLLGMNGPLLVFAYISARASINTLTGVDPTNFPYALATLTALAMVPTWLTFIGVIAGIGCMVTIFVIPSLWRLYHWQQGRALLGLPLAQERAVPTCRLIVNGFGALGIFGLCGLLATGEIPMLSQAVHTITTYTLIGTEFSPDRTCAVSNEQRWIARLKDRKEMKVSQFLIAEHQSSGAISFSIGTCE